MAGEEDTDNQTELLLAVSGTKIIGVSISLFTIDRFGRRPLLILGSLGCAGGLSMVYAGKQGRVMASFDRLEIDRSIDRFNE